MIGSRRSSLMSLLFAFTAGLGGCAAQDGEEGGITADELTGSAPAPHVEGTEIERDFVRTPQLPKTTLKVATAPMQCPLGCSPGDIRYFVEQLKQFSDVDVVVVTEAFFRNTRQWLSGFMKDAGYPVAIASKTEITMSRLKYDALGLIKDTTYLERDMSSGLMIFARKQLNDEAAPGRERAEWTYPASEACGEDANAPKGLLKTRFSLGKAPNGTPMFINVLGTHMQANPELPDGCEYRNSQDKQITRLDEWTASTLERNQDGPTILSGDFNFESTGRTYADGGMDSEVTKGMANWNALVAKVLRPADILPSFRAAQPEWIEKSFVAFSSPGSAMIVRPTDDYGSAHRAALTDIRSRASAPQDLRDGKTGMDDKPGEVIKQFFTARASIRGGGHPSSALVAELVPIRYERTVQSRFCRYENDGLIEVGKLHDPKDGKGHRLVVSIDEDASCTSGTGEMVTLADFPSPNDPNAADKQKHLIFDHATRVATYKLVVRRARDNATVYPAPAAFLHYTAKSYSKADKRVSLSFELTPPPDQADAFDNAVIRARVYEPAEGPWLAVKRTGKYTFVAEGVVPTSACAHYKVNVQVSYDVAAQRGVTKVATGFDQQIVVEQGLAAGSQEWKNVCTTKKDSDITRGTAASSPVLSTR